MFSSMLPNGSSSIKFPQSGPAKNYPPQPANHFSLRVFKAPSAVFPYPTNPKFEPSYRPIPAPEKQGGNWYPAKYNIIHVSSTADTDLRPSSPSPNSYDTRPRATANYSIYANPEADTYIYERSTCSKSDILSDADTMSIATFSPSSAFSPALSTDSTLTLGSPDLPERPLDEHINRPATPATHLYSNRTASISQTLPMAIPHHTQHIHQPFADNRVRIPPPPTSIAPIRVPVSSNGTDDQMIYPHSTATTFNGYIPEYAPSTVSEFEVEERDRIAQINAEYNSASTAAYYATSSMPSNEPIGRRGSNSPPNNFTPTRESFNRATTSQPNHTNPPFPPRGQEFDSNESTFQPYASGYPPTFSHSHHDSPPKVERIPSEPLADFSTSQPGSQATLYSTTSAHDERTREAASNVDPTRKSYRDDFSVRLPETIPPLSSRSARATYATSSQDAGFSDPSTSFANSHPPEARSRLSRMSDEGSHSGSDTSSYRRTYMEPSQRREGLSGPVEVTRHESVSGSRRYSPQSSPSRVVFQEGSRESPILASDLKNDSRTQGLSEKPDRPFPVRRDSYGATLSTSPVDFRQSQYPSREVRDPHSGALTSSPTQMSPIPLEHNSAGVGTYSRRPEMQSSAGSQREQNPRPVETEKPSERVRTNSISVPSTRPAVPEQSSRGSYPSAPLQAPLIVPSEKVDFSRSVDYEKSSRPSPPTSSRVAEHPPSYYGYSETDRRNEARNSLSYASSSSSSTSSRESERRGSFRANARPTTASQNPSPTLPTAPDPPIPQSKISYINLPPVHPELVRRGSDGDKPMASYEKPGSTHIITTGTAPNGATIPFPEPQRRYSDGDQTIPAMSNPSGRASAPLGRSVRWNDNLICPSPIFPSQRRKGWFNRRGDQLWTNDGVYKPVTSGQDYPPDLVDYPEPNEGWMNEEGVRIDLGHRLIPKAPLRSALKQTIKT